MQFPLFIQAETETEIINMNEDYLKLCKEELREAEKN